MMEDFDSDGNVRSSIPVQFLGQVWTPDLQTRRVGHWFDHEHHHDDDDDEFIVRRRRRSEPDYCGAMPVYVAPTPDADSVIDGESGIVTFTLKAQSTNGPIAEFQYQAPTGLLCSDVLDGASVVCTWILTNEQMTIESHSFCFDAMDTMGLVSERRCLTINTSDINTTTISTTTTTLPTTSTTSTVGSTATSTTATELTSTTTTITTSTTSSSTTKGKYVL